MLVSVKHGGGFLLFIDSDDTIHVDILEKCVEEKLRSKADAVVFGVSMNIVDTDGQSIIAQTEMIPKKERYLCCTPQEVVNGPLRYMFGTPYEDMKRVLYKERFLYSQFVWVYCWLYDRKIVAENKILFREDISIREDGLFNYEYLSHIGSTSCVEEIGYEYNKRDDGAASTLNRNIKIENKIGIAKYRRMVSDFVSERCGLEIAEWAYGSYALSCIQLAFSLCDQKGGYQKYLEYVRLEDVHKAISHVPLKGGFKMAAPLFLAKTGLHRILFLGCRILKKFGIKI